MLRSTMLRGTMLALFLTASAAHAGKVTYFGGHLLAKARYTNIYWGAYWTTAAGRDDARYYDAFMAQMATSARFHSGLVEYSTDDFKIGPGTFTGSVVVASDPAHSTSDSAIDDFIETQIDAGKVPSPAGDAVYNVFFPPGTEVTNWNQKSYTDFCGYHEASLTTRGNGKLRRIVLPYPDHNCWFTSSIRGNTTVTLSHEMAESITDPDTAILSVGWTGLSAEGEIGDLCHGTSVEMDGFVIQQEWSNQENKCVTEAPAPGKGGGCPAGMHDEGGFCVPVNPAGCSSASNAQPLGLLLAAGLFVLRRRRAR